MSNSEMIMNNEKAILAKYILSIDNEYTLMRVKDRLSMFIHIDNNSQSNSTDTVLNAIASGWEDTRSADEMVKESLTQAFKELKNGEAQPIENLFAELQ